MNKKEKQGFDTWLKKCPVYLEEHYETSDDDITTINFYAKNIFNRKERKKCVKVVN
tara:strand:+ start:69 stop:236 length:168 start_codon:yes stop_codon:yes gene_type:complete